MDHCKEIAGLFDDLVELSALTLRDAADRADREAWQLREKQHLGIVGRYRPAQLDRFTGALAHVVLAMHEQPTDVLGRLYMELGLGNLRGASGPVVATAELMRHEGMDPQRQRFVSAEGISAQAVHMAHRHLSATGVPAVVHRRDALTRETYDSWPTAALLRLGWPESDRSNPRPFRRGTRHGPDLRSQVPRPLRRRGLPATDRARRPGRLRRPGALPRRVRPRRLCARADHPKRVPQVLHRALGVRGVLVLSRPAATDERTRP